MVNTCHITGTAIGLNGATLASQIVTVSTITQPLFLHQTDGTYQEAQTNSYQVTTNNAGVWDVYLDWGTESDPSSGVYTIKEPNGNSWTGAVPSVSGPLTIHDLKGTPYNWAFNAGSAAPVYVLVSAGGGGGGSGTTSLLAQTTTQVVMQNGATGAGAGTVIATAGLNGFQKLTIANTGTGTCNVNIEGHDTAANFAPSQDIQALGVHKTWDSNSGTVLSPSRIAGNGISIAAGSTYTYQVEDNAGWMRCRISGVVGTIAVTVQLTADPV